MALAIEQIRYDEARTAFYENADYLADDSLTKARDLHAACLRLLLLLPKMIQLGGPGGEMLQNEYRAVTQVLEEVKRFIAQRPLADEAEAGYFDTSHIRC